MDKIRNSKKLIFEVEKKFEKIVVKHVSEFLQLASGSKIIIINEKTSVPLIFDVFNTL